jgi:hypothetical protein
MQLPHGVWQTPDLPLNDGSIRPVAYIEGSGSTKDSFQADAHKERLLLLLENSCVTMRYLSEESINRKWGELPCNQPLS